MRAKIDKIIPSVAWQNTLVIAVIVGCVLFSMPVLALLCVFYYITLCEDTDNKTIRYGIYLLLSFLMGYLNTSKPLEGSDLYYYYWLYNFAGTKTIEEFIALIPKEPLFHIFTYLMYFVTFGCFNLYMVLTTMVMYMLVFISYDIVCRNNGIELKYAMAACVCMLLFAEFFFYTAQIVRQVLAGSVAIYGITKTTFERNRFSIWLIALAGLIHASAFFFSIYYVIYFFRSYPIKYLIIATLTAVVFYGVVLRFLGGFIDGDSTLGLAVKRGSQMNTEMIHIGLLPILICFSVVPMAAYLIYTQRNMNLSLWLIVPVVLMTFILVNFNKPLFVLRFMEYIYMFIPITLVLTVVGVCKNRSMLVLDVVMAALMLRFALKLNTGGFTYMDLTEFLGSGLPVCLFNIF